MENHQFEQKKKYARKRQVKSVTCYIACLYVLFLRFVFVRSFVEEVKVFSAHSSSEFWSAHARTQVSMQIARFFVSFFLHHFLNSLCCVWVEVVSKCVIESSFGITWSQEHNYKKAQTFNGLIYFVRSFISISLFLSFSSTRHAMSISMENLLMAVQIAKRTPARRVLKLERNLSADAIRPGTSKYTFIRYKTRNKSFFFSFFLLFIVCFCLYFVRW